MNEVYCYDKLNHKEFTLYFSDLHKQRLFLLRCKYSHKIMVLGYTWQSEAQRYYLAYGK